MNQRLINNRFTLPEYRTACREDDGDIPVSNSEYKRLRALKDSPECTGAEVKIDQIIGDAAKGCEKVMVEKGEGPKAAKNSALREHDVETGFECRLELISVAIVRHVVNEFLNAWTVEDLAMNGLPGVGGYEPIPDAARGISVGWTVDEDLDFEDSAPTEPSKNRRENFLYTLQCLVEEKINKEMKRLLKFKLNGESIWDHLCAKVKLEKGTDNGEVDARLYFDKTKKK
ncbi:MAG: hypothetical protein AAB540_01580 [Patescibacteria group bacterium]